MSFAVHSPQRDYKRSKGDKAHYILVRDIPSEEFMGLCPFLTVKFSYKVSGIEYTQGTFCGYKGS